MKQVDKPKNKVGKPLKYKSVEDLKAITDEYFTLCDNRIKEIHKPDGETYGYSNPEPYTMSGLAYHLGMSRQTLIDYSNRDEYLDAIKEARSRVEFDVERRMNDKDTFTPGLIFNAKNNFGWKDKTESEITNPDGSLNPYNALTAEELRKLAGK